MPPSELGLLRQQHTVSGVRYLVSTLYLQLECIYSFFTSQMHVSLPYHASKGWFYFLPYFVVDFARARVFVCGFCSSCALVFACRGRENTMGDRVN